MSARALLLSPDDQAVSAITGVLEELSVLCERPVDGASAAQKLNSQTYDLVLVDCDNLPAAKLIFDVCRRAHSGTTIPIAIVDGRAGLPTAFRLGAELILTKPVAKDQARTTIRTAVSRLRKDEPARAAHPVEAAPFEAPAQSIPETFAQAAVAGAASAASAAPVVTSPVAPAKPVELTTLPAPVVADVPETIPAPEQLPSASVKIPETSAPAEKVSRVLYESAVAAPKAPSKLPEESVLEELTKVETELHTPITFSSYDQSKKRNKVRAPMVVLLLLGMMTAAFYAAWMQVPEFRVMVQPQLDKAMTMVGMVPTQKAVAPVPVVQPVVKASAQPIPVPAQSVQVSPTVAAPVETAPAPAPTSTAAGTAETASPASGTSAKTTPTASDDSEKSPEKSKKSASSSPEPELPWEKETVILSSKGAEKRLVHHVQPAFPREARAQKADGTVVLKTLVGGNGSVAGIRVVEGNPALTSAATKAVKQWRYKPYIRDGSRTPFQTIVIVDFQQP
jgi:TonB family protein